MMTEYGLEALVSERLAEIRAAARAAALADTIARARVSPRVRLRSVVGHWLIRLGTLLVGAPAAA